MLVNYNKLPTDINQLQNLVLNLKKENTELKDTILLLQRKKFAPTSEQYKNEVQLLLFNEVEDLVQENIDSKEEVKTEVKGHTRRRGKRLPLPESLPREVEVFDLDEEDKVGMKFIGEEKSEKLEIIPAKIFVKVNIKKKYAPIDSSSDKKVKTAKSPAELLPKSMASASLIAYIITAKYVDALPLYRQEKIFERISADLKRQTMARWLISVSEKLIPLYNLMQEKLLERNYISMDETRVQVLKEDGKKATSKSYMWVRYSSGDNPIILYDYSPSRSGDVPVELLNGFNGVLQIDGYDGYQRACDKYKLIRVGCWDHARRKFFDANKTSNGKGIGKKALTIIKKLYKIEAQIKDLNLEEKLKIRQEKSKPILVDFKIWLDDLRQKITPKSVAGKAVNYVYNEWEYLTAYINHPEVNISNCQVENAIRPFVVGRKNWLFSTSTDGANASAMYYSIIETAKANGFEPFDYLNKMLDKLATANTVEDFEKLLPFKNLFLV